MHGLLRLLPHALTLTNLAAGCVACIALVRGNFEIVPWCLLVSAVADFLDGFAARAAGVSGPFGRELDSLADMVSFGVSPGLMAYVMLRGQMGGIGMYPAFPADPPADSAFMESLLRQMITEPSWLVYLALLIPLMSAVRLARFNIDQADTKHFIGLATPANTVFWFGLFQVWRFDSFGFRQNLSDPLVLLPIVALFSYLLVSNLPLFSNKLDPRKTSNWPVWVVVAAAVVLPWWLGWAAVPVAMVLYVASGLVWRPG